MLVDAQTEDFVHDAAAGVPAMVLGTDDLNRGFPGNDHNSAALLLRGNGDVEFYDKRHLVPFGEYLPLRPLLGWLAGGLVPGDFKPGTEPGIFSLKDPALKLAPLICFEDTLGDVTREPVRLGAAVLVNLTNDGWFGRSSAAEQHFANAVFRTVENRIPLVRCTNTGVTASVDQFGRVDRWIEPFSMGIASRQLRVPLRTSQTFYTRNGDVFSVACAALAALSFLLRIAARCWSARHGAPGRKAA
jgi:apolipoprotein N-acyltransferase